MKTKKLTNKVGRKPLPPELTKTRVATVRLRPHDRVLVEQAADARRMTVGEFCESAVIRAVGDGCDNSGGKKL
jgi:hypothetical protein